MMKKIFCIFVLFIPLSSHSLDLGNLISDAIGTDRQTTKSLLGAIKSISQVNMGKITGQPPADSRSAVIIYSMEACGYCKQAIAHMENNNIPYIDKDIEFNNENRQEYIKLGGNPGVPFIVMGENSMHGFAAGKFDTMYATFKKESSANLAKTQENPTPASGDILIGKIPGIPVFQQPSKDTKKLTSLGKLDEVVFMGQEKDGFFLVTTAKGEGWVDKMLIKAKGK